VVNIEMEKLIEKLTPILKQSLEDAAQSAVTHGHFNIEIEHWLHATLQFSHTDALELVKKCKTVDMELVQQQLAVTITTFKSGNTRAPAFSQYLLDALNQAWMISSVEFGRQDITSGALLLAIFKDGGLRRQMLASVEELGLLDLALLEQHAPMVIGSTSESVVQSRSEQRAPNGAQAAHLDKYMVDLTQKAEEGGIDPVIGRDSEVRQLIDILLRRRQNNPILTGEPGVGKTAVVEGLANRIVAGDVPDPLKGVRLLSLDLGALQAGASVKGEFEKRLKGVIEEVKTATDPIVVFIDEAHTLIGAGGAEGTGDAANLLKPALARGEFRTVAATTWSEYKKYFEKDPALTRRFQVVKVEQPSEDVAIDMMRCMASMLESHHGVNILDEAIEASVKLSARYIPARQLPDKSVSLLDTACARVALSQGATPEAIEAQNRIIEQSDTTIDLLEKEHAMVGGVSSKIEKYQQKRAEAEQALNTLNEQWQKEIALIEQLKQAREEGVSASLQEDIYSELKTVQGQAPMVHLDVSAEAVASIVGNWTGIPVGNMVSDEIDNLLRLEDRLKERVVGQDHAIKKIAEAVRISRSGLTDPRKPVGVFMMVGTSGTGKTETALALADHLYGGEQNLITINMSEFKEEHKISMLLGAPAGYVGYGKGGVLTEAVRKNPYSVVLLDEMEKAHSGIQDVFYNLFDKGTIKDGEGLDIDFKNTLIIMTTNAASQSLSKYFGKVDLDEDQLLDDIRPDLLEDFRPAFLGRSTIVPYFPLSQDVLQSIIQINLNKIKNRLLDRYNADIIFDGQVLTHLLGKCTDPDTGARNAENVINKLIMPAISEACLNALVAGNDFEQLHVDLVDGEFVVKVEK